MKRLSNLFNKLLKPSGSTSKDESQVVEAATPAEPQLSQFLTSNQIPSNSLVSEFVWVLHRDEKPHRCSFYITSTSVISISELTFQISVLLIADIKQIHTALNSFEFALSGNRGNNRNSETTTTTTTTATPDVQQQQQETTSQKQQIRFYFCTDSDRARQSIIDAICLLSSGMKIHYCPTKSLFDSSLNFLADSPPNSPKSIGGTSSHKLKKQPSSQSAERGSQLNFEDFEMLDQIGAQDVWRYFRVRESRVDSKKIFVMRVVNIQALTGIQSQNQNKDRLVRAFIEQQIALIKVLESSCYFIQHYYYIHAGNHFAVLQEELSGVEYRNLSFLLERRTFVPENVMVIIAGQLAYALNLLHEKGIVYRQVNTEDIKIDMIGSLILSRFEFSKYHSNKYNGHVAGSSCSSNSTPILDDHCMNLTRKTTSNSLSGRLEYLSPEMILGKGHSIATDWWSYGILLYEMQVGFVPFADSNAFKMMEMILFEDKICFPQQSEISENAKHLITQCLNKNDKARIQFHSIQAHPFFANLNWTAVAERVPQKEVILFMTQILTSKAAGSG